MLNVVLTIFISSRLDVSLREFGREKEREFIPRGDFSIKTKSILLLASSYFYGSSCLIESGWSLIVEGESQALPDDYTTGSSQQKVAVLHNVGSCLNESISI